MSFRKIILKIIPVMLCILLLFCSASVTLTSAKTTIAQKQSELAKLKAESAKLDKQISGLKSEQNQQQAVLNALKLKISNTQQQISVCVAQISEYKATIKEYQDQIAAKNQEIEDTKQLFKQRVRSIYMSGGENNELLLLLGSDNFADFLSLSELTRSVSAHDNAMIDKIVAAVGEVKAAQVQVEKQLSAQNDVKAVLAEKQAELKSQTNEVNGKILELNKTTEDLKDQKEEYQDEIRGISAEITAALKALQNSGASNIVYTGQGFAWPVPGFYGISSPFGMRWGKLHGGVDISSSGINGQRVVASSSGTVLMAGWSKGGYGNYVTINHGTKDGVTYVTLYGHLSAISVSPGQAVKQGQQIGNVGSTGDSTGPHLHFEIYVNNTRVNPMNYLSKVK